MPQFNIHWKGCPHRHLPHIRIASPSYSNVHGRSHAHVAAKRVFESPLGPALEKNREPQRIRARKRRRGSRESVGFHFTSKRTLGRTRRKLLKGAVKDIMGPTVLYTRKVNRASMCISGALQITDIKPLEDTNDESKRSDSWTDAEAVQFESTRKVLEGSTPRRPSMCSRTRLFDPRLPISRVHRRTKSTSSQIRKSAERCGPSSRSKTSTCVILPSRQQLSMRMSLSSTASTVRPFNKVSDLPHRTLSQQKALKVFTRELERHLVAQEAFRKAGLDNSSSSSSTMSAHSIMELKPYSADFRAAGLAVTSKEQRGLDLPNWRISNLLPAAIGDVPRSRIVSTKMVMDSLRKKGLGRSRPEATSTTCTDTASTDSTVKIFASMDGASPSREPTTPYRQRIAIRKTLPWLREAKARTGFRSKVGNSANDDASSSRALTLASMTTIIDFSPELERCISKKTKTENKISRLRTPGMKWLGRENMPSATIRAPNEPTSLLSTSINVEQGLGDIVDSKQGEVSPVIIASNTSGIKFSQLRADHVFQDVVRNVKVCSTPAKTAKSSLPRTSAILVGPYARLGTPFGSFQSHSIPLGQLGSSEEHHRKNNATGEEAGRPQPKLVSPARSPPPPLIAPSFTSRESPKLTPTCIPNHYDINTPPVFKETLHQVTAKSRSPEEWSERHGASTSLPAARPSRRCNCDSVKQKPQSQFRPSRSRLQTTSTTNQSTLKSGIVSQSQSAMYTDRSVTHSKDVFKGLQIALAAACDEDLDAWITEVSGCRVRRFLADLRVFEGLGANALVEEAMKTARRRRKKMEEYRARVGTDDTEMAAGPCPAGGGDASNKEETRKGQPRDFEMRAESLGAGFRQKALVDEMARRKEARK